MERGIASFIDTIFLMLISATAAAILFYSAAHYGTSLGTQTSALILEFYTHQVLRTISAVTVTPAHCTHSDYLLAIMKKDIYNNGDLSKATLDELNAVVSKALAPIHTYYDYGVYVYSPSLGKRHLLYCIHNPSANYAPVCGMCKDSNAENASNTISGAFGVHSAYAPLRIRTSGGAYATLYLVVYLWPSGELGKRGLGC